MEYGLLNAEPGSARTADNITRDNSDTNSSINVVSTSKYPPKKKVLLGNILQSLAKSVSLFRLKAV